jgi:hypothetical protein
MSLALAQVSPAGDYSIGADQSTGQVVVLQSLTGAIRSSAVNVPQRPTVIELSPKGQAAVLGYESRQMLLVITGLPDHPEVVRSVSFQPPGFAQMDKIQKIAVSDDGQALAFTTRPALLATAFSQSAFYVESGGNRRRPVDARTVTAISFFESSHDLVVADSRTNALLRGSADVTGSPFTVIATGSPSSATIVGLGVTFGEGSIHAATSSGDVLIADPGEGQLRAAATCGCTPDGVFRMPGTETFRLNSLPAESIWVYQGGALSRLVFVPVAAATVRLNASAVTKALERAGQ